MLGFIPESIMIARTWLRSPNGWKPDCTVGIATNSRESSSITATVTLTALYSFAFSYLALYSISDLLVDRPGLELQQTVDDSDMYDCVHLLLVGTKRATKFFTILSLSSEYCSFETVN